MRVCYFGTYERSYPRNYLLIKGLRAQGVEVVECHQSLWLRESEDKTSRYLSPLPLLFLFLRLFKAYFSLLGQYISQRPFDVIMVGYMAPWDMFIAKGIAILDRLPVVFNPLISLYDTLVLDRGVVKRGSWKAWAILHLDKIACSLADLVLVDTDAHAEFFYKELAVNRDKLKKLSVGADDAVFSPWPHREDEGEGFTVLFYGKFSPLQGVEYILKAAKLLEECTDIRFIIIGHGQLSKEMRDLAQGLALRNAQFIDWVPYEELPLYLTRADVGLGVFGSTAKAQRVIPNKVFQIMAMGRPLITGDTPAVREQMSHLIHAYLCPVASPEALAEAIVRLKEEPELRQSLAVKGHELFRERFTPLHLGGELKQMLQDLLEARKKSSFQTKMVWGKCPELFGPRHYFREGLMLRELRRRLKKGKVLDVGCGSGSLSLRLAQAGFKVEATDRSHAFLLFSQQRVKSLCLFEMVSLGAADASQLPFKGECFEAVLSGEVLEHLEDDSKAVAEAFRVLREEGLYIITVPMGKNNDLGYIDHWAGHKRRYDKEHLERLLKGAGFGLLKCRAWGFPISWVYEKTLFPTIMRKFADKANPQKPIKGRLLSRVANNYALNVALSKVFSIDNLFSSLPLGIGLLAVAQKGGRDAGAKGN